MFKYLGRDRRKENTYFDNCCHLKDWHAASDVFFFVHDFHTDETK